MNKIIITIKYLYFIEITTHIQISHELSNSFIYINLVYRIYKIN